MFQKMPDVIYAERAPLPYPNMERLFGYGTKKEKINSIAKDVS